MVRGKHEQKGRSLSMAEAHEVASYESWMVNAERIKNLADDARAKAAEMFAKEPKLQDIVVTTALKAATGEWDAERVKKEIEETAFTVYMAALATVAYQSEYDVLYNQDFHLIKRDD